MFVNGIYQMKSKIVFLFFALISIIYLHNITRDIYAGDIGDLVSSSCVWGVAHPPGYPLFMILGGILCHLPLSMTPVSKVALISIIASIIGLIFFYKFSFKVTKQLFPSLVSTAILGFSYLFWFHAEIPEVFALNNMFIILIFYFAIQAYKDKKIQNYYVLAFLSGLAVAHHHTIIFVFIAVAILLFKDFLYLISKEKIKNIAYIIGLFIVGVGMYIYVPIASSFKPVINWDNVHDFQSFMHLFLRKDYATLPHLTGGIPYQIRLITMRHYFFELFSAYTYPIFLIIILGFLYLVQTSRKLALTFFICLIISGPLFIYMAMPLTVSNVQLGVLERFYTVSITVLALLIPYGFVSLKKILIKLPIRKSLREFILYSIAIIPLILLIVNFPRTNLSSTQIGNNFAKDILSSVPKGSMLRVSGDTTTFNIWYLHYVLGYRKDITLINPPDTSSLTSLNIIIFDYLKKNPALIKKKSAISEALLNIVSKRRIFATYDDPDTPRDKIALIPKGLVYELIDKKKLPSKKDYLQEIASSSQKLNIPSRKDLKPSESSLIASELPYLYSMSFVKSGNFVLKQYNDAKVAYALQKKALTIDDQNPFAYVGLGVAQFYAYKDCKGAIANLDKAIDYVPVWYQFYIQKYLIYQECGIGQKDMSELAATFKSIFKKDIKELVKDK